MAAVPSLGRATEVEPSTAPEADATRALYERYSGPLYSFCLNRLGSREEAEDAVQSTFLNAFRGLQRGVVPATESAWLFKIAENVCLTRHRSAWRRGRVEAPSDMQALQDVLPARERNGDELIPLGDALAAMPESQQRALVMREWQGLSYREIAAEMGVSQSAVETLIFRARRSLASALQTPWEERGARRAGRRAFDLGSLLAGLKTFLAGSTAAKVAVVAVAATGTAAVAASDHHHSGLLRRSAEPKAAVVSAQDSSAQRPAAFTAAPERFDAKSVADPRREPRADLARSAATVKPKKGGKKSASTPAAGAPGAAGVASTPASESKNESKAHPPQSQRPETPPGHAKEPGTPALRPARAERAKPKPLVPNPNAENPKAEQPKAPKEPKEPKAASPAPPPPPPPAESSEEHSKGQGKDK